MALIVLVATFAVGGAAATTTIPTADRVDPGSVRVANTPKKIVISFTYAQAPADAEWAADIRLDTYAGKAGPEFYVDVTNSCGTGISVGATGSPDDPDWQGGCGYQPGKCFKSYSVARNQHGFLQSVTFRKVKGCVNSARIRVTGEFRTLDLADPDARPFVDHVPGHKGAYTTWVRKGHARTFKDRT